MTEEIHPTAKEIAESIDRIARTPDGANLYILLQRAVMFVAPVEKRGALRLAHGERMFAAKLIGLMAKGIYESGGRTSSSTSGGSSDSEQPVVVPVSAPRAVGGSARRTAARRAAIDAIDIGGAPREAGKT